MPKLPRKRCSKIMPETMAAIQDQYRAGEKTSYIAYLHGISNGAVSRIAKIAGLSRGKGNRQRRATTTG